MKKQVTIFFTDTGRDDMSKSTLLDPVIFRKQIAFQMSRFLFDMMQQNHETL